MPGKTGYRATVTLGGRAVSEADNIEITADGEEFDVTDLGDYLVQKKPGTLDINCTGEATYLKMTSAMVSRLKVAYSGTVSFAIKVTNPAGSTVLSGTGNYNKATLTFPRGASKQAFGFHVNAVSVP